MGETASLHRRKDAQIFTCDGRRGQKKAPAQRAEANIERFSERAVLAPSMAGSPSGIASGDAMGRP